MQIYQIRDQFKYGEYAGANVTEHQNAKYGKVWKVISGSMKGRVLRKTPYVEVFSTTLPADFELERVVDAQPVGKIKGRRLKKPARPKKRHKKRRK